MLKPNALLSSEARNTKASALLRKHKSHCKPKLPRVPNLLEQFVIQNFARLTLNLDAEPILEKRHPLLNPPNFSSIA
ncbi:hypothetical protein CGJ24_22275 [Vibrio parahaemolyticus]|nr:hypothetical protein CGJ24_22275 [Vibrio parahaemolyticus]